MTAPIYLRPRYPTGLLQHHPPLRSEAEAAAEIAARAAEEQMRVARHRMRFILVDGCRVDPFRPLCKLIASRAAEPTRVQPCITVSVPRSWLARILGRRA
jgi:hypothetical protein